MLGFSNYFLRGQSGGGVAPGGGGGDGGGAGGGGGGGGGGGPLVHITDVHWDAGQNAIQWTFDTEIASMATPPSGFLDNGRDSIGSDDGTGTTQFRTVYGVDIGPGDSWSAGPVGGITFVGGGTLVPASGVVGGP